MFPFWLDFSAIDLLQTSLAVVAAVAWMVTMVCKCSSA
jgi:hypothetical protein